MNWEQGNNFPGLKYLLKEYLPAWIDGLNLRTKQNHHTAKTIFQSFFLVAGVTLQNNQSKNSTIPNCATCIILHPLLCQIRNNFMLNFCTPKRNKNTESTHQKKFFLYFHLQLDMTAYFSAKPCITWKSMFTSTKIEYS